MDKGLRNLYERIKGYDVESLEIDLRYQLEGKLKPRIPKNFKYNHKANVLRLMISIKSYDIRKKFNRKRVTLEQIMVKSPELIEGLLGIVSKALSDYGCVI